MPIAFVWREEYQWSPTPVAAPTGPDLGIDSAVSGHTSRTAEKERPAPAGSVWLGVQCYRYGESPITVL